MCDPGLLVFRSLSIRNIILFCPTCTCVKLHDRIVCPRWPVLSNISIRVLKLSCLIEMAFIGDHVFNRRSTFSRFHTVNVFGMCGRFINTPLINKRIRWLFPIVGSLSLLFTILKLDTPDLAVFRLR